MTISRLIPSLFTVVSITLQLNRTANAESKLTTNGIPLELAGYIYSAPSNNLCVVIETNRSNHSFITSEPFRLGFLVLTNSDFEVFRLAPEYGFRITGRGTKGQKLSPTSLGATFGSKFDSVRKVETKFLDWTAGEYERQFNKTEPFWTKRKYYSGGRAFLSRVSPGRVVTQRFLPPLEELLRFDGPGTYMISVEVQCFVRNAGHGTNLNLIRFPPVQISAEK